MLNFNSTASSWAAWLCVIGYSSVFLSVIGILGSVGGLFVTMMPAIPYRVWCVVVFALVVVLLWRGIYEDLEKMVTVLVALFSLVVIGSLLVLQGHALRRAGERSRRRFYL